MTDHHLTVPRSERGLSGSQTLARGLAALRVIGESVDGMSANGIAEALRINISAAYRLLRPLVEYGFLRRDPDSRYRLGALNLHLAEQTRLGIRSAALPVLSELSHQAQVTAMLFTAEGNEAVVLAVVEPSVVPYRVSFMEGQRHPMDRGSAAYAIRAARPPQADEPAEVTAARSRGYAMSAGEIQSSAYGMAQALDRSRVGVELCLNVGSRSETTLRAALPHMQEAVERLTVILSADEVIDVFDDVALPTAPQP